MKKLLMIDDTADFTRFVDHVARSQGFEVQVATSAESFRRIYEEAAPDVIMLGVVMPEVDGFELTAWLCERGATARLLLVSDHNPVYAKWLSQLAEVNGDMTVSVLRKPMPEATLVAALKGGTGFSPHTTRLDGTNGDLDPPSCGDA